MPFRAAFLVLASVSGGTWIPEQAVSTVRKGRLNVNPNSYRIDYGRNPQTDGCGPVSYLCFLHLGHHLFDDTLDIREGK